MMENSGSGAATEDRIAGLEKKMREMEALVKGLTQELLDLKSISMKLSKQTDERRLQELKRGPTVIQSSQPVSADAGSTTSGGSTVVMRKGARQPEVPATPPEPVMDLIMQQDGTMKLEPRRGEKDYIVARAGYGQKKGAAGKPKQADLIYAAEDEKKDPAKK